MDSHMDIFGVNSLAFLSHGLSKSHSILVVKPKKPTTLTTYPVSFKATDLRGYSVILMKKAKENSYFSSALRCSPTQSKEKKK